jgi:hypothetical protein
LAAAPARFDHDVQHPVIHRILDPFSYLGIDEGL